MPNFDRLALASALVVVAIGSSARAQVAQPPAQGFQVERLYPSAAGAGWLVMDALDQHGGIGGAISFTLGYERNPLRVGSEQSQVAVVQNLMLIDISAALTYRRWRFHIDFGVPVWTSGNSTTFGNYAFTGASTDWGSGPDVLSDIGVGTDLRIAGRPDGRFRLGASAELLVPNGNAGDYGSDGTFRGLLRILVAGDVGHLAYAANVGAHIRPRDDTPVPNGPRGSELVYGAAVGVKVPIGRAARWKVVVGPELFGASAFRAFDINGTALEWLMSGRIEGTADNKSQLRVRLGIGNALNDRFGAPDWRIVAGVELFGRRVTTPTHPAP